MDCCSVKSAEILCPLCGIRGRKVGTVTLNALVDGRSFDGDGWKFCFTASCPVAYYHESEDVVPVEAISVRVTQKSNAPDRPVCYCFGFSAQDIIADETGAIPAEIKHRCGNGEDRCSQTNPQGSCCLGNVLVIARQAST